MFALILTEKGGSAQRLDFDKDEVTIGRVPGNDIVLQKGNVSKRHSRLVRQDGRFFVVDLKSTNGTYLNGRRITTPSVIKPGDKIYVGDFIIELEGMQNGQDDGLEPEELVEDVEVSPGAGQEAPQPIDEMQAEAIPLHEDPASSPGLGPAMGGPRAPGPPPPLGGMGGMGGMGGIGARTAVMERPPTGIPGLQPPGPGPGPGPGGPLGAPPGFGNPPPLGGGPMGGQAPQGNPMGPPRPGSGPIPGPPAGSGFGPPPGFGNPPPLGGGPMGPGRPGPALNPSGSMAAPVPSGLGGSPFGPPSGPPTSPPGSTSGLTPKPSVPPPPPGPGPGPGPGPSPNQGMGFGPPGMGPPNTMGGLGPMGKPPAPGASTLPGQGGPSSPPGLQAKGPGPGPGLGLGPPGPGPGPGPGLGLGGRPSGFGPPPQQPLSDPETPLPGAHPADAQPMEASEPEDSTGFSMGANPPMSQGPLGSGGFGGIPPLGSGPSGPAPRLGPPGPPNPGPAPTPGGGLGPPPGGLGGSPFGPPGGMGMSPPVGPAPGGPMGPPPGFGPGPGPGPGPSSGPGLGSPFGSVGQPSSPGPSPGLGPSGMGSPGGSPFGQPTPSPTSNPTPAPSPAGMGGFGPPSAPTPQSTSSPLGKAPAFGPPSGLGAPPSGNLGLGGQSPAAPQQETGRPPPSGDSGADTNYLRVLNEVVSDASANTQIALDSPVDSNTKSKVQSTVQNIAQRKQSALPPGFSVEQLVKDATAELAGHGAIDVAFEDPGVTTVVIEGFDNVSTVRNGTLSKTALGFSSNSALSAIVDRMSNRAGVRHSAQNAVVETSLPDGLHLFAAFPPVTATPTVVVERSSSQPSTLNDLSQREMLSREAVSLIEQALSHRKTIVVCGARSSGRTTLVSALLGSVLPDRCVAVERGKELPKSVTSIEVAGNWQRAFDLAVRLRGSRLVIGDAHASIASSVASLVASEFSASVVVLDGATPSLALGSLASAAGGNSADWLSAFVASKPLVVQLAQLSDGSRKVVSIGEPRSVDHNKLSFDEAFAIQGGRLASTGFSPKFTQNR